MRGTGGPWASLVAQTVKRLPARWETWVQSLGWEDPLEKEIWQPTPVFWPGESHGRRSLIGYSPWGCTELGMTEWLHFPFQGVPEEALLSAGPAGWRR